MTNTMLSDIRSVFTDATLSPTQVVHIFCPMHPDVRKPSMAVYPDGHAYCFTCGAYLSRRKLLEHINKTWPEAITAAKLGSRSRPVGLSRPTFSRTEIDVMGQLAHTTMTMEHRRYFRSRGLTDDTIDTYKLGHYGFGYTLPLFEEEATSGPMASLRFRRDDKIAAADAPKYWGIRGSNEVSVYPFPVKETTTHLFLLEGEFDALLLRQEGLNAYSLTNGARAHQKVKDWTLLLPKQTKVSILYDKDAAGEEAATSLQHTLVEQDYQTDICQFTFEGPKDIGEFAAVGGLAYQQFLSTLQQEEWASMENQ